MLNLWAHLEEGRMGLARQEMAPTLVEALEVVTEGRHHYVEQKRKAAEDKAKRDAAAAPQGGRRG